MAFTLHKTHSIGTLSNFCAWLLQFTALRQLRFLLKTISKRKKWKWLRLLMPFWKFETIRNRSVWIRERNNWNCFMLCLIRCQKFIFKLPKIITHNLAIRQLVLLFFIVGHKSALSDVIVHSKHYNDHLIWFCCILFAVDENIKRESPINRQMT